MLLILFIFTFLSLNWKGCRIMQRRQSRRCFHSWALITLFIDSCSVCFLIRKESSSQLILTTRASPRKRSSLSCSSNIPLRNALPHKNYLKTPMSRLRQEIVSWTKCSNICSLYELYSLPACGEGHVLAESFFCWRRNLRYWNVHETVFWLLTLSWTV